MTDDWPFDQGENVAAITTRQVQRAGLPVLQVVHYVDDGSWAFTCGTTCDEADAMVAGMGEILGLDPSLYSLANLPAGWSASRPFVGGPWQRFGSPES